MQNLAIAVKKSLPKSRTWRRFVICAPVIALALLGITSHISHQKYALIVQYKG